jgi:hypothetical protein
VRFEKRRECSLGKRIRESPSDKTVSSSTEHMYFKGKNSQTTKLTIFTFCKQEALSSNPSRKGDPG